MKNLLKKGFVAIEVIVIAAVCILGGMAGTSAFLSNGKEAQSKYVGANVEIVIK